MSWVKLDDGFFRNPKVLAAGRDARDIYIAGLCYCAQGLTDGIIPKNAVRVLAAETEVDDWQIASARLVEVGLWEQHEKGYQVHDYLDYNPSRDKALATKDARREAGRRGGKQKASNLLEHGKEDASSKTLPRTRPRTNTSPNGDNPPTPPEPKGDKAFDLFVAMCEELGTDPSEIGGQQRGKQLAAGKRLADGGATADEVRREIRWLSGLSWVNGIDLNLVESQRTKWITAGRPDSATPAPKNGVPRIGPRGTQLLTRNDLIAIANGEQR